MRKLLSHLFSPSGLLYVLISIGQVAHAVYMTSSHREPTPTFSFIYAMGFLWLITAWLFTDSRKRGINLAYEMGMFLYIAWPIYMPYHLIKTRGARGLLVILGFLVVYIGAWMVGLAVSLALFPNSGWPE